MEAFGQVYGLPVHTMTGGEARPPPSGPVPGQIFRPGLDLRGAPTWIPAGEARFAWGTLRLDYSQAGGISPKRPCGQGQLEGDFSARSPGPGKLSPGRDPTWRCACWPAGADPAIVTDILTLLLEEETP